ncbi:tyrosine-protein phosphatase Lar isoform X2 [Brevipalpus obovatus]|uniref:tyrosine-protein phosphatase Lar isoform X2 n=1 Tax=Brevipalpus obovatus TaxID=246614 RepID=UPI003D9DF1BF
MTIDSYSLCHGSHYTLLLLGCLLVAISAEQPAQIITPIRNQTVAADRTAFFVCIATGDPKPKIHWRKNGKVLSKSSHQITENSSQSVLRIDSPKPGRNNGTYECIAENGVGEPARSQAVLKVIPEDELPEGFPVIDQHPKVQGVEKGRRALVKCVGKGKGKLKATWYRETMPLNTSHPRYQMYGRPPTSLEILSVEDSDQGPYECTVENDLGIAYSEPGTLFVKQRQVAPYFSAPPEKYYIIYPGKSINISCLANGTPNPTVIWKKGDAEIKKEGAPPELLNFLYLENVRESANYTCVASSKLGKTEAHTQVIVKTLPRAPLNVRVTETTSTSITIAWTPDQVNEKIDFFVVQYKPKGPSLDVAEISGIQQTSATISNLTPYSEYEITVTAANEFGKGSSSKPLYVATGDSKSGGAPRDVTARTFAVGSIVVDWNKPEQSLGNIVGYRIYYTKNPSLPISSWQYIEVDDSTLTTVNQLTVDVIYAVRVAAITESRGEGPLSAPVQVRTKEGVPNQPQNLQVRALGPHSIELKWKKPTSGSSISGYNVYINDTFQNTIYHITAAADIETRLITEKIYPDTLYFVSIAALSNAGEGAPTPPVPVRTEPFIPGEPRSVKATVINSTTIKVEWKPPSLKDQKGIIRGYQIHIQEMSPGSREDFVNDPMKFDVLDQNVAEFNVTPLQPDTPYSIQVAAVTRKGDGARSKPVQAQTLGGVPSKPDVSVRVVAEDPQLTIEISWSRPNRTYGSLQEYRLQYGKAGTSQFQEISLPPLENNKAIKTLDKGVKYEFRLAGRNTIGWGQDAIAFIETPEGPPSGPPGNLTYRLQSPTTVVVNWDPPLQEHRNGKIINYGIHFDKASEVTPEERYINDTRIVFSSLDENAEYSFRVRAFTTKGPGPWSSKIHIGTPNDVLPAPSNVQAMATSEESVEVWWDRMPFYAEIQGFLVLYTQTTAVEDLDSWMNKTVPLTYSAELTGLKSNAMYAIRVAAYTALGLGRLSELITVRTTPVDVPLNLKATKVTTHTMTLEWRQPTKLNPVAYRITYEARKEFIDSQGTLKTLDLPPIAVEVNNSVTQHFIGELLPFTSYQVNVSAVPLDRSYRPPARRTVTTARAAPKPMVKPDFTGIQGDMINVVLPQASEEYGLISHYYLVVVPSNLASKDPDEWTVEELSNVSPDKNGPYIAAKFPRREVPDQFLLGDGEKKNGFLNKRLSRDASYRIFVRAIVDAPHKNLFRSSPYSDSLSLNAPMPPTLQRHHLNGPNIAHMGTNVDGSRIISVLAVLMIGIIIVVIVSLLIFFNRRRQLLKSPGGDTTLKLLMSSPEHRDLMSHPSDPVEMRRLNYQTPAMVDHPPIPVTELANHIERLRSEGNLGFSKEYESIEPGQQFTWENSSMEVNKPKNRYANVIAYDHSRVVLQPLDGIPGSDYINANYCDGYRKQNAYIASQGPLPETIGDFWRMIWEQRSVSVVMMTKLEERARIKCDQYWPSRGTETYDVMQVTLTHVEELSYYCIRTFTLQRYGYMESREVRQFQFTAWPDHGVPDHPTPFLMFLRRVKTMNPPDAGPMIIHCSAGVGRTGCFIVIDSMLERLKYENSVDIYGHSTCLRAQRNYMVQTEDQYIFIHDAILEAVISGITEIPIRSLYNHVQMLMQIVPGDNITGMELEFKKIASMRTPPNKFMSANLPCNKFKNRLMNILPYETSRVCLQPLRGVEGSDYINASFIDGYRYKSAYVATQGPMPETTDDFWRMLWEHNSNIIVMLTKVKEMGREKCHYYWPSERSQRYLYFVVDPITEYNMPQYILREFKVTDARDGQSRTVRQFHFVDWPEQGVPKSGEGFIDFINQVHKTKEQFGQEGPITVHCSAGVGRTGVFISMSIVLERIQNEGVVDLFQTVRILRTQRPGMVQTEDQYQFCYRAALEYLSTFDYAN